MNKKQKPFSDQIVAAIEASGQSRYAIAKATGLQQSTLSRFVNGDGWINREGVDTLAEYLGLEITTRKQRKAR